MWCASQAHSSRYYKMGLKNWSSIAVILGLFLLMSYAESATNPLRLPAAVTKTLSEPSPSDIQAAAPSFNCSRKGLVAKYGSCRDYYQCEEITESGLFIVYLLTCPPGMTYDDTLEICDAASRVITRPECLMDEINPGVTIIDRTKPNVIIDRTKASVNVDRTKPNVFIEKTKSSVNIDRTKPSVNIGRTKSGVVSTGIIKAGIVSINGTDRIDVQTNIISLPLLKRQKRFVISVTAAGIVALSSLITAGVAVYDRSASRNTGTDLKAIENVLTGIRSASRNTVTELKAIENVLTGIDGKINDVSRSVIESQVENRFNSKIIQNLVRRGIDANKADFEITQELIRQGILDNQLNTAVLQGLILEGNRNNKLNFAKVHVSINEVKQFISQEMNKAKSDIRKGFSSISNLIKIFRIEPVVTELLSSIKEFRQKLNHLQMLSENAKLDEIKRNKGFLEYLESSTLQNTLNDIIIKNFAVPIHATDKTALFILDLLVYGLEIHVNMLSSIIASNVYLSEKALKERSLEEFNSYMARVSSYTVSLNLVLQCNGLISEVDQVLVQIQQLPFAADVIEFTDILSEKKAALDQLRSDVKRLIIDNTQMDQPGKIWKKLEFNTSSVSVPIGPWENGKEVSYAIQFASEKGLSRVGEWSKPYTVQDKACPTIQLPTVKIGVTGLVYRKFNQEKPELVGLLKNNKELIFRDIGRDIINAAARSNEDLAIQEIKALINNSTDVNVALENGMTPLHYASKYGNLEVMKLLIRNGADIKAKSYDNKEALHFAALYGLGKAVDYLVNEGADVNSQTRLLGFSSLHIAVANNHVDATQALIRKGAFINIKDNNGLTPLHTSIAVEDGDTTEILLEDERVGVNIVTNDRLTPLHYAAQSSKDVFVRKLLQHKDIDISPLSESLLSPLHLVAMNENINIMKILTEYSVSVSAPDKDGSTPLHYAAFYGNLEAVLFLKELDPSLINMKNNEGKTALFLAVENDRQTVIEVLKNSTIITPLQVTGSNCSKQVEDMARSTEDTCIDMGHVQSYVNHVMGMIPLRSNFDNLEEFSQIIANFSNLEAAQHKTNISNSGDSFIKEIRQTIELADKIETEFIKMHQINKNRVLNFTVEVEEIIDFVEVARANSSEIKMIVDSTNEKIKIFHLNVDKAKIDFEKHARNLKEALKKKESEIMQNLNKFVNFSTSFVDAAIELTDRGFHNSRYEMFFHYFIAMISPTKDSLSTFDQIKKAKNDFTTVNGEFQNITNQLDQLLTSINKVMDGFEAIHDVLDILTDKLGKTINKAKEAETEAQKINARLLLYNALSSLGCIWKEVYSKIMELDECTKNFKILLTGDHREGENVR